MRNLSFSIPKGQIVGLLGPNGAGQEHDDEDPHGVHRSDGTGTARVAGFDVAAERIEAGGPRRLSSRERPALHRT